MNRCSSDGMRSSWVWNFARGNLGRLAAIMLLHGHIRPNVQGVGFSSNSCLLLNPHASNVKWILLSDGETGSATHGALTLMGCYIHYSPNDGFIRSGKATSSGQSFKDRLKQHAKSSKLSASADIQSAFYTSYPSMEARVETAGTRKSWHEDLKVFCGAAFSSDVDPASVFVWSAISKRRIDRILLSIEPTDLRCAQEQRVRREP